MVTTLCNGIELIVMEIWNNILITLSHISWLEALSVLFGIAQVLLSKNNRVLHYPMGILGILAGMLVYFDTGLYAELLLQMYYLVMSVYGWWYWTSGTAAAQTPITWSTSRDWATVGIIVVFGFGILYFVLSRFTDSDVPVWDAWVASTAWAGMWLLAKRKIENWWLLNLSNFFAIPLLVYKELYLFAALTLFLFTVAIFGYFNWKKELESTRINGAK